MKKVFTLLTLTFLICNTAYSQDAISIPDTLQGWETSWSVGLNGSQASYSNWSQGGVNNIAVSGNSGFSINYKEGRIAYGFLLTTRYGKSKIENEGVRKIDDRLSIRNRVLYDLGDDEGDFKLFGNVNFRTQFDKGFEYGAGPNGEDILISEFMAPGYLSENIGLAYVPSDFFSFEAGLGLQQTFVRNETLSETYGLDAGETFRNEAGLTFGIGYQRKVAANLSYSTNLETFTNLNKTVSSTDLYFANQITGRINSFMNASLRFDLAFDDDFSEEVQVAQILSLGVSFTLL
jgi:hypothetical protein